MINLHRTLALFIKHSCRVALPPIAILLFLLASCQPTDTYEAHYDKCMENVKITEFTVEGSSKKGLSYHGFDERCLIGAPLPFFQATNINGQEINTRNLKGKITIINFWFIKCAPCVAEMPLLNAVVEKYGRQEVNYLSLAKDSKEDVEKFLQTHPFLFTHIPDAESIINDRFRLLWGYPSTIVVNPTGEIIEIFRGAKLTSDPSIDVATALDNLLQTLL